MNDIFSWNVIALFLLFGVMLSLAGWLSKGVHDIKLLFDLSRIFFKREECRIASK